MKRLFRHILMLVFFSLLATGCAGKKCKKGGGGGGPGPGGPGPQSNNGPRDAEQEQEEDERTELQRQLDDALAQLNDPLGNRNRLNNEVIDNPDGFRAPSVGGVVNGAVPDGLAIDATGSPADASPGLPIGSSVGSNQGGLSVQNIGFAPTSAQFQTSASRQPAASQSVRGIASHR